MLFSTSEHSLLAVNDQLWVWGSNIFGELGLGHREDVLLPEKVDCVFDYSGIQSVKSIAFKSFVVTKAGNIYSCGKNDNFQITRTDIKETSTFVKNPYLDGVAIFDTTNYFCLAITHEGKLYIWGKNRNMYITKPRVVDIECDRVYNIYCSYHYALITTSNGLWVMGYYDSYKTSYEEPVKLEFSEHSKIMDIKCSLDLIVILTNDDKIFVSSNKKFITIEKNFIEPKICSVSNQIWIIHKDMSDRIFVSRIFKDVFNNLTLDNKEFDITNIIDIVGRFGICNNGNIFIVTNDNEVYCKGNNHHGVLGLGYKGRVDNLQLHPFLSGKKLFDSRNNIVKNARSG